MNPAGGDANNNNNNNAANLDAFFQGYEVLAPENFAEFGVGVNAHPPHPNPNTGYLLALVGDNIWLNPEDYRFLITQGQMIPTEVLPPQPQPPALYMVRAAGVPGILEDGYNWHGMGQHPHVIDDGPVVNVVYQYQNVPGLDRVHRRIYRVPGYNVLLIHYRVMVNFGMADLDEFGDGFESRFVGVATSPRHVPMKVPPVLT